jgi:4'-phosphopantetheinyl transferase EntD
VPIERTERALRSMAPPWVRTGVRVIDPRDEAGMWPNERMAIAGAVARRRAEFATGRALLRLLIGHDVEIPIGSDRRPRLPDGVTATLAHDRDVAVAAVTTRPRCRALGIDIEPATTLDEDVARLICGAQERHLDAHLVFVLKEAAYKAWSSSGGRMLEHSEVSVDVDPSGSYFTATVTPDEASFAGRYTVVDGRWLALVACDD